MIEIKYSINNLFCWTDQNYIAKYYTVIECYDISASIHNILPKLEILINKLQCSNI